MSACITSVGFASQTRLYAQGTGTFYPAWKEIGFQITDILVPVGRALKSSTNGVIFVSLDVARTRVRRRRHQRNHLARLGQFSSL